MDPSPRSFPVLSYVMARLPSFGSKTAAEYDASSSDQAQSQREPEIVDQMPQLSDPKLISAMRRAILDVYQTRSVLQALGPRPDHETVDKTKAKVVEIESELAKSLEAIVHSIRATDVDQFEWRVQLAERERECRENAEKEKSACAKILELDDMHEAYKKMLREAEERLVKIYERAGKGEEEEESESLSPVREEVNEEVMDLLQEAAGKYLERVDLSSRRLRFLPEAFGRIAGLRFMNLSNNQLETIPDSISGLVNLEELSLASNLLETLPDSIGFLYNLKFLNVSGNKLTALPDSISHCRSLVVLDASFNRLAFLPTNIGHELVNLQKLLVSLNKIRFLPTSIGEMASLRHLDAHFNELHCLPATIGKLTNLEILNLSSNFTDMKELPESFGELTNLEELDLSNNQIQALPNTFGRLDKLTKLNLEENPIVMPPVEVVKEGIEAVKLFMAKRWLDILLEEERRSVVTREARNEEEGATPRWLTRSTSWLKTVGENVSEILSPRAKDPCLDQQL